MSDISPTDRVLPSAIPLLGAYRKLDISSREELPAALGTDGTPDPDQCLPAARPLLTSPAGDVHDGQLPRRVEVDVDV